MAIFRGTGGAGSSSDSTIVDAVTAQAGIATTKAGEASTSATTATTKASEASTSATTATTKASEASTSASTASTKATEANTAKTGAETAQTAAEAARDAALGHSNTANSSAVQTVAGSNTQVVGVYNNIANVNTVAGVNTDVTTVAGISSDVTTVAADALDIGTVSTNIANVNNVGNNIANVNAVHGNASNINTVAPKVGAIEIVALKQSQVQTVSDNINDVTTVVGLESKMDTVIADASDIGAVAGNIGDVSTVAGINADVDTVAGIAAKVTTVADNITDVQNADTNATNAASSASNASASATSASNSATTATTKATEASNSATAASNSAITATAKASQAAGSATTAGTSESTATTKASEASASATTATTKAGLAASSASAASGSASTATTKAAEADASANSAATSATNSSNAASTWNNFYTSYLGTADAPPTTDVQGNAIVAGALYYDTGAGSNTVGLYVYNGSTWVYSTNYNNVTAPYSLAQDLATNSHDINFGVNAKAQFGASNDLQIFHNGNNSFITDTGAGSLYVRASDAVWIQSADNESMAKFNANGSVDLSYNNATKLSTTSTGIDVTGTVTADEAKIDVTRSNTTGSGFLTLNLAGTGGEFAHRVDTTNAYTLDYYTGTTWRPTIKIEGQAGDISFYEDTGTTPKFFWDASAERLGIGTTSPSELLHVTGASTAKVQISSTSTTGISGVHFGDPDDVNSGRVQYEHNTDHMGLYTNNTEKVSIDSSGNVGVGTSNPNKLLHVSGGDVRIESTFPRLYLTDSNNNADYSIINNNGQFGIYDDTNATYRMVISNTSGNVGIGTNSITDKLTVYGGIKAIQSDSVNTSAIALDFDSDIARVRSTVNGTGTQRPLGFFIGGSEKMRIASSGNVGIGTPSPATALDISQSNARGAYLRSSTTGSRMHFLDATTSSVTTVGIGAEGNNLVLHGGGSEFMRVASSGKVGIGTTSPSGNLHINGNSGTVLKIGDNTNNVAKGIEFLSDTNTDAFIKLTGSSGTLEISSGRNASWGGEVVFSTDTVERMRIDSSGNVLVGKTATGFGTAGIELFHDNQIYATSTTHGLAVNRLSTDGALAKFYKNGSPIGSIGTTGGDMYVGTGDTGIRFDDATNHIRPCGVNGANLDATIDIGDSSRRFKDLYLSGTAYSDNLLVGTTSVSNSGKVTIDAGANATGLYAVTDATVGYAASVFERSASDGDITVFKKGGTSVGSISADSGYLAIGKGDTGLLFQDGGNAIQPRSLSGLANRDAAIDLGVAGGRFKDIHRSGSTYSTSDRNKKQDIRDLTDAEARVAVVAKGSLKAFRYIDTVEADGDDANIHFGIIAQDLKAAFEAEGLNANNYQVLKTSTYTDDDGVEQTTYSVCYENLLAFIISAI